MNEWLENHFDDLLLRARAGDHKALGKLLNAYHDYLRACALRELRPEWRVRLAASDLVQETLLDAQRNFVNFQGTEFKDLQRWLFRIQQNNLLDFVRQQMAQKRLPEQELPPEIFSICVSNLASESSGPRTRAEHTERDFAIEVALAQLDASSRDIIIWRHRDDLSFSEIALRLGTTERAAQKRWARAIERLREDLGRHQ